MIEEATYSEPSQQQPVSIKFYEYDDRNNMIEIRYGRLRVRRSYKYDDEGRVTEAKEFDSEGRIKERFSYEYDTSGKWVASNYYDAQDKIEATLQLKYDSKGNVKEQTKTSEAGAAWPRSFQAAGYAD